MLWDRNVDLEWWVGDDLFFKPLEDMFDLDPDIEAILRNHFPDHHLSIEGPWVFVHRGFIPEQGWKIHISAVDTNALRVLDKVCNVLKRYPVSFKVLKHKALHLATNSKGFPRGSSGKWITIYPIPDLTSKVLESLYDVLYDEVGPYILSDIRYKNAKNVYIRYGGFVMKHMINLIGEKIPHILSPSGSKYVDKRLPYFTMPPWVTWDFNFPNTLSQEDTGEISLKNGLLFTKIDEELVIALSEHKLIESTNYLNKLNFKAEVVILNDVSYE
ncbi:MAG: hypothetical protein L3J76_00265, partial [Candidatus Hydrothermae bacterium]|nr:hypothetical protein [Candidatus Hydrothermae bacterium]